MHILWVVIYFFKNRYYFNPFISKAAVGYVCLFAFTGTSLAALPSPSFLPTQVDKHIRRLDTDLARFEADLKEKQIESSDYDSSSSKGKKSEEGGGP